jgi:catechol 2,3-dioxygenase-like lactoylglutathione lyase family enzyme
MYTRLQPILFVQDLGAEVDFYTRLGFEVVHESADFVGLAYGDTILFGLQIRPDGWPLRAQPLIWQIGTDDIDAVHRRCLREGLEVVAEPAIQSWGEWLMRVKSPGGYHVVFEGSRKP